MERSVAVKKLRKLLGNNLGYRINTKAPTAEEKAVAQAELIPAREAQKRFSVATHARYKAVLAADAEYQKLLAAQLLANKHVGDLSSIVSQHKFTVGVTRGMFFVVEAEGDSWEEIFDKLAKKASL